MSNSLEIVDFTYCQTADLQLELKVRIASVEGVVWDRSLRTAVADPYERYLGATSGKWEFTPPAI